MIELFRGIIMTLASEPKMQRFFYSATFALMGFVLMGCRSGDHSADHFLASNRPESSEAAAEPFHQHGNSYRAMLTREALLGLNYASGRVTVERTQATNITRGLSIADAERQHQAGQLELQAGQTLEAIKSLTKAVILNPQQTEFLESLGRALLELRKPDLAEAAFRTALDLNATALFARHQLAFTLSGTGQREESIRQYKILLGFDPRNAVAHGELAIQYYYSGKLKLAQQHVELALATGGTLPLQFLALLNRKLSANAQSPTPPPQVNGTVMPIIGDQMRVDLSNIGAGNETTASASSLNPQVVVVGWNDYGSGNIRSGFATTFDAGGTWQDFLLRPPNGFGNATEGDPMTCFDNRTGNLWAGAISFGSSGGVYVARLDAGDTKFQPSVMARVTGGADKGWMAAGPDPFNNGATRLYIGYNQGLLVSTDNGDSWSGPTSFPEFGLGWLPRIGPRGELYLTWWDVPDRYKIIRSLDGGATFEGPFTIAIRMDTWVIDGTRFPGRFRVAPLVTSAIDPTDGTLYATYCDTTEVEGGNANVDIYLSRSVDQGTTWSMPAIVNSSQAVPGDQFFPWIEVDGSGRLHMLFYDTRAVAQNDNTTDGPGQPPAMIEAWYAVSDNKGDTWSEFVLTPAPFSSADDGFGDGFIGDYLGMGVAGTTVYPCYMSTQEGIANIYVHNVTHSILLGDINRDGTVNLLDVEPFVDLLSSGQFDKTADINGDGVVNLLDVGPFVALLTGT